MAIKKLMASGRDEAETIKNILTIEKLIASGRDEAETNYIMNPALERNVF